MARVTEVKASVGTASSRSRSASSSTTRTRAASLASFDARLAAAVRAVGLAGYPA